MTGPRVSQHTATPHDSLPEPRSDLSAREYAELGIFAAQQVTMRLTELVEGFDDIAMKRPSLLPGWSRGHVVTHLARNADALVNLLTWARTGVEHPMYTSRADRDADIEEGSYRMASLLREGLDAAVSRFFEAVTHMDDIAWAKQVMLANGRQIDACVVPWMRWQETAVHMIDLDAGVGFVNLPDGHVELLLDMVVREFSKRPDVPPVRLRVDLPDGRQRDWELAGNLLGKDSTGVGGPAPAVLAWLIGRGDGSGLAGELPSLPAWL
ncbi:maleylpyruvate isomerase [Kibdelosporangium banguiense]|uniref:Maleylpyruvate isomerase n=1 Tax=Kibdelosporangium banguiense TaxID=1365924 RepID=A0ABS4TL24_9PSEU|nr:maleylpyruvate isomerase [Kibdelosporangium banguiense]